MKAIQHAAIIFLATTSLVVALTGCGAPVVPPARPSPPVAVEPPNAPVAATADALPAARVIELPAQPGPGNPRDVAMLVDIPGLKMATIVLRKGTLLPTHQSDRSVTIVALQGAGTVTAGTDTIRLDATHAVVLAPNVPHAVQPDAGTDLVLLVHHVGVSAEVQP